MNDVNLLREAARLLRDIGSHEGLMQGGEQYPNALNCYDVAQRLWELAECQHTPERENAGWVAIEVSGGTAKSIALFNGKIVAHAPNEDDATELAEAFLSTRPNVYYVSELRRVKRKRRVK